jgi:hypothetical protein
MEQIERETYKNIDRDGTDRKRDRKKLKSD